MTASDIFSCFCREFLTKIQPPEKFSGTGQWVSGLGLMFKYSQSSRKATRLRLRESGRCAATFCAHGRLKPSFLAGPLKDKTPFPSSDAEGRRHATSSAEIMRRLGE